MSEFFNTNYNKTVSNLIKGSQSRMDNPYYVFSGKSGTPVTYYNINIKKSTLDQGTRNTYDHIGENSPLRFNKINNFQIYGIDKIQLDYNVGEFGVESPVEGEAFILPNTIIPCVDDMFLINYLLDKPVIFRVNKVTIDTLDTGANFYKINYYIDRVDETALYSLNHKQLIKEYNYMPGNAGSNFIAIIEASDSDLVDKINERLDSLREYYINLFFKANIQTFVYPYNDMNIYDPYLIEFMIRNGIYSSSDNKYYMYISQAVHRPDTFAIEYDHTIFKDIENRDHNLRTNSCYPVPVHDPNSLLVDRMEDYFELSINILNRPYENPINWLDMDLFDKITENTLYDTDDESAPLYRNIIIQWMNNSDYQVTENELKYFDKVNWFYDKKYFYEIPILIYMLTSMITDIYKVTDGKSSNTTDPTKTTNELASDMKDELMDNNNGCSCSRRSNNNNAPTADDTYMSGR